MAIANSLAFMLYLCCGAILIRNFVQKDSQAPLLPIGLVIVFALIFHAADIFFTMRLAGGWDLSLFSTLSVATWIMALIVFLAGFKFPKAHPGMVIYPLVALSLILKQSLPSGGGSALSNPALEWHILLSLTAYSLFTLAAIQSIILAIQESQLRKRQLAGAIQKLPPLQSMESGLFQLINSGFVFLTIGLFTGFLFLDDIFAQQLIHKTVLSLIGWCVFATLLWGRKQYGWRGKTAVKWTLVGFSFLVLAYIGSKLVLEYILTK
jgi:ABC-type uncharacterized transport system permease subunit